MDFSVFSDKMLFELLAKKRTEWNYCVRKAREIYCDPYWNRSEVKAITEYYYAVAGHIWQNFIIPLQDEFANRFGVD